MKMTPEHFESLKQIVEPLDTPERREKYRNWDFPNNSRVQDLDKRYRWDLFYGANPFKNWEAKDDDGLVPYSDAHIYTALKKIVPSLLNK